MKLSYSLASELSEFSIETVKRHVKKMIEQNLVQYSKKGRVKLRVYEKKNKKASGCFKY